MSVDRCICYNISFKRLHELAVHLGADLDELQNATGCGTGCGMCTPYIKMSLRTGKHRLPIMTDAQAQQVMREPIEPVMINAKGIAKPTAAPTPRKAAPQANRSTQRESVQQPGSDGPNA